MTIFAKDLDVTTINFLKAQNLVMAKSHFKGQKKVARAHDKQQICKRSEWRMHWSDTYEFAFCMLNVKQRENGPFNVAFETMTPFKHLSCH